MSHFDFADEFRCGGANNNGGSQITGKSTSGPDAEIDKRARGVAGRRLFQPLRYSSLNYSPTFVLAEQFRIHE
jgi:hypothetical protein